MAVPNLWRTKRQRYSLHAEICPTCTKAIFPPREICPHCHQAAFSGAAMSKDEMASPFSMLLPTAQLANAVVAGDD